MIAVMMMMIRITILYEEWKGKRKEGRERMVRGKYKRWRGEEVRGREEKKRREWDVKYWARDKAICVSVNQ